MLTLQRMMATITTFAYRHFPCRTTHARTNADAVPAIRHDHNFMIFCLVVRAAVMPLKLVITRNQGITGINPLLIAAAKFV